MKNYSRRLPGAIACLAMMYGFFMTSEESFYAKYWKAGITGLAVSASLWKIYALKQEKILAAAQESSVQDDELPSHVKNILDQHKQELQGLLITWHERGPMPFGLNVARRQWLPGYYIKYDVSRVKNARKIKNIIRKHNLSEMAVAEKYLYHVSGRPEDVSNENYLVIAKEVIDRGHELSVKQAQQFAYCKVKAKLYDTSPENYVITQDNKVTLLDTADSKPWDMDTIGITQLACNLISERFRFLARLASERGEAVRGTSLLVRKLLCARLWLLLSKFYAAMVYA